MLYFYLPRNAGLPFRLHRRCNVGIQTAQRIINKATILEWQPPFFDTIDAWVDFPAPKVEELQAVTKLSGYGYASRFRSCRQALPKWAKLEIPQVGSPCLQKKRHVKIGFCGACQSRGGKAIPYRSLSRPILRVPTMVQWQLASDCTQKSRLCNDWRTAS